jgi:DNA-directed RNA polymerase subunit beta
MSKEEVLAYFYDTVIYAEHKKGWQASFDPEAYRGVTLEQDMINAKNSKWSQRRAPR